MNSTLENAFHEIESEARKSGADVEMLVTLGESFAVGYQKGKMDKFDSSTSHCAGFRVLKDGYPGYAYSEDLSVPALKQAYQSALENAAFAALSNDPNLKMSLLEDKESVEELKSLYSDDFDKVTIEEKKERAKKLEEVAKGFDSKIASVPYSGYREVMGETLIFSSTGLRRKQRYTLMSGYTSSLAKQGDESRMAYKVKVSQSNLDFDAKVVAEEAAKLALAKLGAVSPKTGKYPVVLENEVASEFFGLLADYFSAKAVYDRDSLFGDELGKDIASSKLTISDDPFYPLGRGTRAFDSEGAKSRKTPIIQEGKLASFLTNSVYAKRMNLPHTANASRGPTTELGVGVSNLVIEKGQQKFEELMNFAPQVILVTDFQGYHSGFKSGSGDFSLQAEGELWENGKRVGPLCNFVVSGNVRDLLKGIEGISDRVEVPTSSVVAPDILVRELSVAGSSN